MSAADGRWSRSWGCQLVLLAGLSCMLTLLLLIAGPQLSDSRHSSVVWRFRAPLGYANVSTSGINCSKSQLSSTAAAAAAAAPSWPPSLPVAPWPFPGVRGSYSEADVTITPWCNATFSNKHPLTAADYERSFTPGGVCSMPGALLNTLQTGSRELTITVVGGSMTEGVNCHDGNRNRSRCSWPSRMQDRLSQLFPAGRVSLRNMARPAWSYSTWLESGVIDTLVETDVLIIDLQVNSQVYKQDATRQMEEADLFIYNILAAADRQRRSPGIMFVENFLTCGNCTALCNAHCPEDRQGRMQYNFVGQDQTYGWCNRWWTIGSMERPIVQHYQLPTVSYREAVWPSFANPSPYLPCFWNGFSHPDAVGHLLVGDVVTYGLVRALSDSSRDGNGACRARRTPTRFHQRLTSMRYCTPPLSTAGGNNTASAAGTYMNPANPSTFHPLGLTGPWTFREDRPGKPGWIFEPGYNQATAAQPLASSNNMLANLGPANALASHNGSTATGGFTLQAMQPPGNVSNSIWFRVAFSSQPQLQVTYLTSYKQVGVAELAIYSSNSVTASGVPSSNSSALAVYVLDGRIRDRYSIPRTSVLVHPKAPGKARGQHVLQLPEQVQQGEYVIAIRPVNGTKLQGTKFKLLGLSSC